MLEFLNCSICNENQICIERGEACDLLFNYKSPHGYRTCYLNKVFCAYCQLLLRREKREVLKTFFDFSQKANTAQCNRCSKFYDKTDLNSRQIYDPLMEEMRSLCLDCSQELMCEEIKLALQFMSKK